MQNDLRIARSIFLRSFFCTSFILLLMLCAFLGIHQARINTEQICFGDTLPDYNGNICESLGMVGPFVKM